MPLTDTQATVLALIAERIEAEGMPPSQTEIARALGFKSVRAAQYHLDALEAAGAIERLPGRARGIRLLQAPVRRQAQLDLPPTHDALLLPVLGRVAAGLPIGSGADAESDRAVVLDRALFAPAPDYLLEVRGDSMRDDGILDGDLVAVQRTPEARDNQIVVARLDGELTVKRLQLRDGRVRLLPRNPEHAPIDVPPGSVFAIEGVYCGLLRQG